MANSKVLPRWEMEDVAASLLHPQLGAAALLDKRRVRRRSVRVAARRRLLSRGGVALAAVAGAAWMGSLAGSGALDPGARFNADRLAAQSGAQVVYGPAALPDHPGATAPQRQQLIRQFIALDGVN